MRVLSLLGYKLLPQDSTIPKTVIEVSINTFVRSSNFIPWSMLPNHITICIYKLMGSKCKHGSHDMVHISINESIGKITSIQLINITVHTRYQIKEKLFNTCPSL